MLRLLRPTDPKWVECVESQLHILLVDHAHCELKAAQSALSLVARFGGDYPHLVEPLCALAREESTHFEAVQRRISSGGETLGPPRVDMYVKALHDAARPEHPEVPMLLDRLLVSALVEARSCERFHHLSKGLKSSELRDFYRDLMISEARHYRLFRDLAEHSFGRDAELRFRTLVEREAAICAELPLGPTVHG
ncbi:MAG: tRNA isopentenyl-2-thiomethyl-A-37 hydroxylase MiaE [Myxococcota bacterium]